MTTNDTLLHEGIAAARLGQRARARTLLMQVVEADERNEQGWLWLSAVVDDPADQRVCLENVLDINPHSAQAQKGIAWLDTHHPVITEQPVPTAAPSAPASQPEAPVATTAALPTIDLIPIPVGPLPHVENPCPFCGSPTRLDQQRCVQCKRSLLVRDTATKRRSIAPSMLALLWIVGAAISLVLCALCVGLIYGESELLVQLLGQRQGAALVNAGFSIIASMVLFSLVGGGVAVGLLRRQRWALFAHIALSIVLVAFSVQWILNERATFATLVARNQLAPTVASQGTTVAFATLAGIVFLSIVLTFLSYGDFFSSAVRVTTNVPERNDDEHYNMGVIYKNRDMWYMATKEWEGAVQRRPSDAEYRRALGLAYAQIHQFGRGVRELREALRLRQGDQRIRDDLTLVEGMALKEMQG